MFKIESYKKGIVLSSIFNVFNKGLVFINGMVVAYFFGATHGTDIFFFTYNSLIILAAFFMNTNSAVIIPESMRIRVGSGNNEAMRFLNFFIYLYALILCVGLALILINPVSFFEVVSNFPKSSLSSYKGLLYLSLPLFGMACLITLLIDILTSYKFFTISMVVGIINGIISILIVFCFHRIIGIRSAFCGLILSYMINLSLLVYILRKKLEWTFRFKKISIPERIWKNLAFAQLGNFASSVSLFTPVYILSGFNAGIITALTFAQQISSLPNALITTQFSSVAGIKLNELFSRARTVEIDKIFTEIANLLHFIMIPISCLIFLYSDQIVGILQDFTSIDKTVAGYTSVFMKYLGILLPFYVSNTLMSRLFMASHKIKEAFWYQLTFNIIQIIFIYVAVKMFGIIGYPVTLIIIYFINTFMYYFVEKHYFNMIGYGRILLKFLLFVLVNAAVSAVVFLLIRVSAISEKWTILITASFLQILLLLMTNHILKLNEKVSEHIHNFTFQLKEKVFVKNQKFKNGI